MESDNIIYISSLYNNPDTINTVAYNNSINIDDIQRQLNKTIYNSKSDLVINGDILSYFAYNNDIIFNDQTNFSNFKNKIKSYTSYIYYYIFFFIFIVFIILHYIYININGQFYSYLLVSILILYTILLAYNNYLNIFV